METPEGGNEIFIIAKNRDKATKILTHIKQIKDSGGRVLTEDVNINYIYFETILNEEDLRSVTDDGEPNEGMTREVREQKWPTL